MTNELRNYTDENETIDLCACYEPILKVPQEVIDEWNAARDAEKMKAVPTFYGEDEDGTLYFYYGKTRIRVSEHFNDGGKPIGALIEGVIRYSVAHQGAEN